MGEKMSMKEALERGPMRRKRTIKPFDMDLYRGELTADISIFEQSGVTVMLNELKEIIEPNFPDVQIIESRLVTGHMCKGIQWNGRNIDIPGYLFNRKNTLLDMVRIRIDLSGDLYVGSEKGEELITRAQWSSDHGIIENSLADAYRDPLRLTVSDPPLILSEETRKRMLRFPDDF